MEGKGRALRNRPPAEGDLRRRGNGRPRRVKLYSAVPGTQALVASIRPAVPSPHFL